MTHPIAVVLAAGKGTRMESDLPKVLVKAAGRSLVEYVLDALSDAGVDESIVVVGYRGEDVKQTLGERGSVRFAEQTEQLGTGHAVKMCMPLLEGHDGPVLVLTGDSPMTQASSLRQLLEEYEAERPACILGTLIKEDPTGLGRIVRDRDGEFRAIVEEKDASEDERAIQEVNMSTYIFDCKSLLSSLRELKNDNRQGEYYITDCPGILQAAGKVVKASPVLKPCEALSVNNMQDLRVVEDELKRSHVL
ncbi:MAG: NTP transferase domain-containing protein [Pirellulaceae bacterium]|nr:NTP transferase domain-containing protein [Pirellulaceae bacterium]